MKSLKSNPTVLAVIPARYGSTRFPGKPLAPILGKPMIQWVYERASQATRINQVLVATDDERIRDAVESFGGDAVMTASDHPTGTDRIAEAVSGREADLILNVQGDEPLIPPAVLDRLVQDMIESDADMGTVAVPFAATTRNPASSDAVKVVVDQSGNALYFSRALIPHAREGGTPVEPLLHWGLYAYQRTFLETFVKWPQSTLEKCEMLEQLRALDRGAVIRVLTVAEPVLGVDRPEDIAEVEKKLVEDNAK
jgi:3-deoxy-manno-octulosonate cytidylyltransferase (CMP-KDO synthetase)